MQYRILGSEERRSNILKSKENNNADIEQDKFIPIDDDAISIAELRHLGELSNLNKALNVEEFQSILAIYLRCANRLEEKGKRLNTL